MTSPPSPTSLVNVAHGCMSMLRGGGTAAFSPRLRSLLCGIGRADSVSWDAHKWLSVPMSAGIFFCRHRAAVRRVFDVDAAYLPSETGEGEDLYRGSVQWSRRFIG